MEIDELLKRWGIPEETVDAFLEQRVKVEDLQYLTTEDLKELAPLIGVRTSLKLRIKELEKNKTDFPSLCERAGAPFHLSNQQEVLLDTIVEAASDMGDSDLSGRVEAADVSRKRKDLSTDEESSRNTPCNVQQFSCSHSSPAGSKQICTSSRSYDLSKLLESGKGKSTLQVYENTKTLSDSLRSTVAEVIIHNELRGDLDKRVTKERAEFLAQQVVAQFPTELLSTWYREEKRPNAPGKVIKGRITRKYQTLRNKYKRLGLLQKSESGDESSDDVGNDLENCDEVEASTTDAINWLQSKNVLPWPRVMENWSITSRLRMRQIQKPVDVTVETHGKNKRGPKVVKVRTTTQKVATYTQEYPQLLESQGFVLIETDFEFLYKDALLQLSLQYEKLEKFVLHKLRQLYRDNMYDDIGSSARERNAFIFLNLCKLFPVVTAANVNKKSWRVSRQEIRDSFLVHAKGQGDLLIILKRREEKLLQFKLTDQPVAAIIGPSLAQIQRCIVKYDQTEYELRDPLKAVDVAFKCYWALHAEYPPESEALWLFLQKAVYGFTTKWDKHIDAVERLVVEFAKFE